VFVQYGILQIRRGLRCRHLHFLAQKALDFSKFMVCPHREGGYSSANIFYTRGKGLNFLLFGRMSFMDGPLCLLDSVPVPYNFQLMLLAIS